MVQITSRKELKDWLKNKPADFAQVIAARAALRVLPYAFLQRIPDEWVTSHSLTLFRALVISWAACNFPAYNMRRAAAAAANAAYTFRAAADEDYTIHAVAEAAASASNAASSVDYAYNVRAVRTVSAGARIGSIDWGNLNQDCVSLISEGDPASASRRLTREPLWPAGEPEGWSETWVSAVGRLAA